MDAFETLLCLYPPREEQIIIYWRTVNLAVDRQIDIPADKFDPFFEEVSLLCQDIPVNDMWEAVSKCALYQRMLEEELENHEG